MKKTPARSRRLWCVCGAEPSGHIPTFS